MSAPPRFVARPSRLRLLLAVAGCIGFVVLSAFLLGWIDGKPKPPFPWAGWLGIVFFGGCGVILARRLFDPTPRLVIGPDGIYAKAWAAQPIHWSEIADLYAAKANRQRFICIVLRDDAVSVPEGMLRHARGANRAMGFGDLAISTAGTDRRYDELAEAVFAHFRASGGSSGRG